MAQQQEHQIMRQVLELHACPEADARRLQGELRDTYYRRLVPLIDKVCSDLSQPGRIHRIDRLEIHLGTVPLDALETALHGRFEAAFTQALSHELGQPGQAGDAQREALERFVHTGTLPWWTDLSDPQALETCLESLLTRAPHAVRETLRTAPDPQRMRRRMVLAYPDRLLARVVETLAPGLCRVLTLLGEEWVAALERVSVARGHPARLARGCWWEAMLRQAQVPGVTDAAAPALLRAALASIAGRLAIDLGELIEALARALGEHAPPGQPRSHRAMLLQALQPQEPGGPNGQGHSPAGPNLYRAREEILALVGKIQQSPMPSAPLWQALRAVVEQLPAPMRAPAVDAFEAAQRAAGAAYRASDPPLLTDPLRRALAALSRTVAGAQPTTTREQPAPSPFSDADELYVQNAGLVLLWPFLASFFAQLGLVEDKAFKDPTAMQRAAGLLQVLATGQAPDAEHLLPLNKLLCGMPVEEVFDFGPPPTDAETQACDDLLLAAISQAPVLRQMSPAGLRASFLLRNGQLSPRDGGWLLRVEHETHDIVLARFPWSVGFVKLPWMQALMQVEWSFS